MLQYHDSHGFFRYLLLWYTAIASRFDGFHKELSQKPQHSMTSNPNKKQFATGCVQWVSLDAASCFSLFQSVWIITISWANDNCLLLFLFVMVVSLSLIFCLTVFPLAHFQIENREIRQFVCGAPFWSYTQSYTSEHICIHIYRVSTSINKVWSIRCVRFIQFNPSGRSIHTIIAATLFIVICSLLFDVVMFVFIQNWLSLFTIIAYAQLVNNNDANLCAFFCAHVHVSIE